MFDKRLILASASPRRRELLQVAGFKFEVRAADIDETRRANELPERYVQRLALEKAHAIAALEPDAVVLGADTTVVLDGEVMNKPADRDEAEWMLLRLSGQTHQVYTGIAAVHGADPTSVTHALHVETTNVRFREIEDAELAAYLDSGDPLDKAGAYGIQGYAARWIPRIEGDYFNVVGLPVAAVVALLGRIK